MLKKMIDCIIKLFKNICSILSSLNLWSALGTVVLSWMIYDFYIHGYDTKTLFIGTYYSLAFGIFSWILLFDKKEIEGSTFYKVFILLSIYIPIVLMMVICASIIAIGRDDLSKLVNRPIDVKEFFFIVCQSTLIIYVCIPVIFNDLNRRLGKINKEIKNH